MTFDISGVTRSGFLDRFERFAKGDDFAIVRLVFENESPVRIVDLTFEEFMLLTSAQRDQVRAAGSIAGYVDTAHKSNA